MTMMAENRRLPAMYPSIANRNSPEYEEYTVSFAVKRDGDRDGYHLRRVVPPLAGRVRAQ